MIKLDTARAFWLLRYGGRSDVDWRVKQLKDALGRSHRRLQDVVLVAEILDGPEESLRVLHERDQRSDRRKVADDVAATNPDERRGCDRRKNFDDRIVHGVSHDGVFERLHMAGIDVGKLAVG